MEHKNNSLVYGAVAKWFHWLTAVLILITYCAIYYREWLADSDFENWLSIQLHLSIGLTLAVIIVLRLVWRLMHPVPVSKTGSHWQQLASRVVHIALYLLLIIMPLSGYLSIADYLSRRGEIDYFFFYDMTWFRGIEVESLFGLSLEQLEKPAAVIHGIVGEWIMLAVIVCHVLAALYHQFIIKDGTLSKMTFFKTRNTQRKRS
ncbi:cytochrome b [Marinicella litoralis]|uniref:Cytochrome b561 n=1 Tax=Marinicella litoralis TaxID=644220 RepID=A0A4R6XGK9_9GAMM|nr:cytochrome b [Marinicella litoralis]TDR17409.1 cytochrome b561 [Marinicella litoralis]